MNDCRFGQPYSLFHSLDLDWILKEVKTLREEGLTLTALRDELHLLVGSDSETAKNSDALGGLPAEDYLKKTETAANAEKLGGIPAADYLTETEADSKYALIGADGGVADDSARLGGLPASDYLTKTTAANTYLTPTVAAQIYLQKSGTAADSSKLGGLPAADYLTETEADSKYAPIGAGAVAPPVGSVLIFTNATDPASLYANTEWTLLDNGQFLMQAGGNVALGATGGEAAHTLTVAELANHTHTLRMEYPNGTSTFGQWATYFKYFSQTAPILVEPWEAGASIAGYEYNTGPIRNVANAGQPHNNIPPYLAVNIWERTA